MSGYSLIGLDNPKDGINIGAVMRAASCFGAAGVFAGGSRIAAMGKIRTTDTMKAHRRLPLTIVEDVSLINPYDCQKIAVDLVEDAVDMTTFVHPKRAIYIFGPEDGTLGARVLDRCQHKIFIPTNGCLNLAATVNVVLYDRLMKAAQK